jgi:hypothetical protein
VTIASGLSNIVLPNGGTYSAGGVAVLSEDQYSVINPSVAAVLFSSVVEGGGPVDSVNGQTGVVVLAASDVSAYSSSAGTTLAGRVTTLEGKNSVTSFVSADRTRALSALADVTGLGLAIPVGTFEFDFLLPYVGGATSNALVVALNGPTNSQLTYFIHHQATASTINIVPKSTFANSFTGAVNSGSATTVYLCRIFGTVTTTASGTLQPQFGSNDNTSTVVIKAGAKGRLWPL